MLLRKLKLTMVPDAAPTAYARYPYQLAWRGRLVAAFGGRSQLPEPHLAPVFTFVDGISHDLDFTRWVSRSLPGARARDFTLHVFDARLRLASSYAIDDGWVAITHQWHPPRRPRWPVYYHLLTLHYQNVSRQLNVARLHSIRRNAPRERRQARG